MKFTVVVPTRERCDTLASTLKTCLAQDWDALEVLVADNDSKDATRDVVHGFRDPRVRYVNSGRRLSVARNWDFALSHVTDGFVTVVGDDDGLLPDALADLAGVLRRTGARALAWYKADYIWPSHPVPSYRDGLYVPLGRELAWCPSRPFMAGVARFRVPYNHAPGVYNAVVDARVIAEVRARTGGTFIHSVTPDAYSGFAVLAALDGFLLSRRPFSVNGASGHSTGSSSGLDQKNDPVKRFLQEIDLPLDPRVPIVRGSPLSAVAEALYQVDARLFGRTLPLDRRGIIHKVVRGLAAQDEGVWRASLDELVRTGTERGDRDLVAWVTRYRARYPNRPVARVHTYGLDAAGNLVLDATRFGVRDVEGACRLTRDVVGPYAFPGVTRRFRALDPYVSELLRRAGRLVGDRSV